MCLTNKVILVTGGNKGIGAAVVEQLHTQGAILILHYNSDAESANALMEKLSSNRIFLLQANLAESTGAKSLWEQAMQFCNRIDVIVNCAGTMQPAEINLPYFEWKNIWNFTLQLNVISLAWLTQTAAKYFAENIGGIIINISSRAAYIGSPDANYLNYAASKGAVMSLTKTIARAYAKKNVLAYVIAPGLVETDMTKMFIDENGRSAINASIPLGEVAQPADIAETIVFLASGKARHSIGSTFHINGGSYL
jgi:3-oxoacyl-[acyl-carrier protein] reductase